jgi:hypothetical protein
LPVLRGHLPNIVRRYSAPAVHQPRFADVTEMRFDTKIVVVLRGDLPVWQQLNMTAFLSSGVAAAAPESIGEPYADADGTPYLAMFGQPAMVFEASADELGRTLERALGRGVVPAVFTAELFSTGHDAANRAAVAAVGRSDLDLTGLAFRADRKDADKITKGLKLHG